MLLESKPTWSIESLPDLTGKVALVTGGNSGMSHYLLVRVLNLTCCKGIGFETSKVGGASCFKHNSDYYVDFLGTSHEECDCISRSALYYQR
jgi:hypothetical protein